MPRFASVANVNSYTRRAGGQAGGGGGYSATLLNGLIAYWALTENNANRADTSGNSNTLTDRSTTASTSGLDSTVATFSSDYMDADFLTGVTSFTIAGRIRFNGTSQGVAISKNNFSTSTAGFYFQHNGSSQITFDYYGATGAGRIVTSSKVVTSGVYYHFLFSFDASNNVARLVIDGDAEAASIGSMGSPPANLFTLGRFASGAPLSFSGQMGRLHVWNRVLGRAEELALYNAGSPIAYPFTGAAAGTPYAGPYKVVAILGQSNGIGFVAGSNSIDRVWPAGCKQWGRNGIANGAIVDPYITNAISGSAVALEHSAAGVGPQVATTASLGLAIARIIYAGDASVPILLVPCASGSTGFTNNHWNPGNTLYEDAVSRVNAAMATHASNTLHQVIWQQGEHEVGSAPVGPATYTSLFTAMLADFRSRVTGASTAPVTIGGMNPTWVASATDYAAATKAAIQAELAAIPSTVLRTAYADPSALTGTDNVHYSATGYRGAAGITGLAKCHTDARAAAVANV